MDKVDLILPSIKYIREIEDYKNEYSSDGIRVTYNRKRIPGMDYLEDFNNVTEWLAYCDSMKDRITWFMCVKSANMKIVGFCCIRHRLEYDDDDIEFASHIGYSIRPSERRKGYAKEQLRLALAKAYELGIDKVRIVCRDINEGSNRTIIANGGRYIDSVYGSESGLTINRYEIDNIPI